MKQSIFEKNLRVLRNRHPILFKAVDYEVPKRWNYETFTAKNGSKTLSMEVEGKKFQIHSKYDPEKEAIQQITGMKFRNPKLMVILGLGLGYHIRAALEVLKDEVTFIVVIERDLNAFKEAIHQVDLTDLWESPKLRWLIGVPDDECYAVSFELIKHSGPPLQLFLKTLVVFDHPALTQVHSSFHKFAVKQFREAANATIMNYGNCPEDSMMGVENIMDNLGYIIRNPGVQDLFGKFKGFPGLLVSTGPSLDRNIQFLKGIEDKCVMICADSALMPLLRAGVRPHGFASLERVIETVETYKHVPEEDMKNIWLMGTPVIRPEGYQAWKGPTFIVYRDFADFKWIDIPKGTLKVGMSCSNMAFKILEEMGCDPIILVGQDCSFQSLDKTHASGTRGRLIDPLDAKDLIKIKGNYDEWVITDKYFEIFRKGFVSDISLSRVNCINCTAGGAFIEGTKLMPLDDAVKKYCIKSVDALEVFKKYLKIPSEKEIPMIWKKLKKTIQETITEVRAVIDFCEVGVKKVDDFEKELADGNFVEQDDFLKRFPDQRLNDVYNEFFMARNKLYHFGKYFNLYLMHIIQMIIVQFEMDFFELPSLCDDLKRCKLQSIRMMKRWFPKIRDVCKLSLILLERSFEKLEKEFGSA